MICDGRGCSVIAHLHCYFSAGSQDANDAITDIEHWHCENCGGLPRHMHPRPPAAKRARVSFYRTFGPILPMPMEALSAQGSSATGHLSGGWGGHWSTRTAMPPPAKGKGKEAMETPRNDPSICDVQPPATKRHAGPRPSNNGHPALGGGGRAEDTATTMYPSQTDAMLVDEDPRPPITSLPTGVSLKNKRGPKTKSHNWSKNGHGGHQRREFKCQGWQSGGPSSSDPSL